MYASCGCIVYWRDLLGGYFNESSQLTKLPVQELETQQVRLDAPDSVDYMKPFAVECHTTNVYAQLKIEYRDNGRA